jgi:putative peptide zinc metalloprotease protein
MVYRLVVFFGILMYLLGQLFGLGVVLAAWSFAAWFLVPTGTFIGWLASSPQLSDKRGRALLVTLAMAVGLGALVGGVPLPDWRRTQGVIESRTRVGVFAGSDGKVASAPVKTGQKVKAGDIVMVVENPELEATLAQAHAERAEYVVRVRDARAGEEPAAVQIVERQLASIDTAIAELETRRRELVVRATADGVIVNGDPARMVGMWVKRGQGVAEIVDTGALRVHALMAQGDVNWLFGRRGEEAATTGPKSFGVEFRLASDLANVVDGGTVTAVPTGQKAVPHGALTYAGGGSVEPETDAQGRASGAKSRRFSVYIQPAEGVLTSEGALPGERVYVRFTLPSRSLAWQVIDRVKKTLQGRVNL